MDSPYLRYGTILLINTVVMFFITYAMIDTIDHFYLSTNKLYMALMMVAPMAILMLLVMRSMYRNHKLNFILTVLFAGLFAVSFAFARTQTPIGNSQFLRSMIPHHSSAILMCGQSELTDPEIIALCRQIIRSQQEEIAQMKEILSRY